MEDAATRFYERNYHQNKGGAGGFDPAEFMAQTHAGNGRYSQAWAWLEGNPGRDVLELGCGHPDIPRLIAPITGTYTMIDIVEGRLGDSAPANVRPIKANLDHDWPVPDASCDVVLAMMVIEHLYDPFHSFAQLARVARPGGTLFVNLPNVASIRCRLDLLLGRLPFTSIPGWFETGEWDGNHLHFFTVASVRRIAAKFGLEVTALHPVGAMAAIKRLRPQLLCHEITYVLRKR